MSVTLTLTDHGYNTQQQNDRAGNNVSIDSGSDIGDARESELILFDNTTEGLGLKICGGCSPDGKEDCGIFIKRVLPGGLAEAKGDELQNGDLILEVNGQSMEGITYDRAVSLLRQASASNHVELVVTRDEESRKEFAEFRTKSDLEYQKKNSVVKVTHFDPSDSLDRNELNLNLSGLSTNTNGHISPSSSHSSEVANHLMDAASYSHTNHNPNAMNDRMTPHDSLDSLLSKKLLHDPDLKLHIDQLNGAMTKLGLELSPQKHQLLRERLTVDKDGMVQFEEFAKVLKTLFRNEMGTLKGRITPLTQYVGNGIQTGALVSSNDSSLEEVVKERDALRAEVASLKEDLKARNQSCKQSEEQLLFIRKQAQSVIEEGRSLRTKLHLAEQAQARAQQTERDYEEVVAMLENEVAQLRLQGAKSDTLNMQKRLAVLVCQLKKAESGMKTYEVATEKLVQHVEHALEVLSNLDKSPRVGDAKTKAQKKKAALATLSSDGRQVIKLARSLMETVALPFGWEEAYTSEGVRYYINHLNQTTTWTHPVSCMEHQTKSAASQQHHDSENASTTRPSDAPPPPPLPVPPQPPETETQLPSYKAPPPQQEQHHHHHYPSELPQRKQQERQKIPSNEKSEKSKQEKKHSPRRDVQPESALI